MVRVTIDASSDSGGGVKSFDLHDFNDCSVAVDALRMEMLFTVEVDGTTGWNRFAEQAFLRALSHLEIAQRELKTAWMEQLANR
jgi:hypothetical protein